MLPTECLDLGRDKVMDKGKWTREGPREGLR